MRDPRYWRHKDPALVAKVTEGFQRLFKPSEAEQRAELGQTANVAGATGPAHARDVIIGHLAPGEIVVPPRAQTRAVPPALQAELGDDIGRFTVGSGLERRNPVSGLPAFAPENEDDSDGFFDAVEKNVNTVLQAIDRLARGQIKATPHGSDPDDLIGANPARFLDQHGLRDEAPLDMQNRLTRQVRPGAVGGGGRKCTPIERRDPLSPCYVEPSY